MVMIPVAEYSPDMPDYQNPGSSNIRNCVPRTEQSYGPFQALSAYGDALTAFCQGAYSCLDPSDNVYVFAGDRTDLYKYTSATKSIVSNGTNPYNCSPDERWQFTLFGQRAVATDFEHPLQSYLLGVSTTFQDLANGGITALTLVAGSGYTNGTYALTVTGAGGGSGFAGSVTVSGGALSSYSITNTGSGYPQTATISIPAGAGAGTGGSITLTIATIAPKARYIAPVKGFLVAGNTTDSTSGAQPQRVWWSGQNDPTNWPTPGTALAAQFQSSYNDLFSDGGFIKGIVGNLGTADGAVLMEHAIWRMVYVGSPVVFDFFPVEGAQNTGLQAPFTLPSTSGAPDVHYLSQNTTTAGDENITSANTITLTMIDRAVERARGSLGLHTANSGFAPIRPIKMDGNKYFVQFLHTYQVTDLRINTASGQWLDISKAAMTGGEVDDNPIFTGALGIYNGTLIYEDQRVTTGVNSSTASTAVSTVRRGAFAGAQAVQLAFGRESGKEKYTWVEELFDYENQLGVSAGLIYGMKTTQFNSSLFGSFVTSSYAVQH